MAEVIVPLVISIALSALSYYLLNKPQDNNPVRDEKPATVASRGSFVPLCIGIRRFGPVVGWVGSTFTTKKSAGGGGKGTGGKTDKVTIYHERGWHLICVGPAYALHRILLHGKTIWKGPIYRETTPSGSTLEVGGYGAFKIYWGEPDQPVNTYLGDESRVGVSSRWPYLCYVTWRPMRLGQSRSWPILDYEMEIHPEFSTLTRSRPWIEGTTSLQPERKKPLWFIEGPDGTLLGQNVIVVRGKHRTRFFPGQPLFLEGNTKNPDGNRIITSVTYNRENKATVLGVSTTLVTDLQTWYPDYNKPKGKVTPYGTDYNDGANPAHVLEQLLFEEYPHGLGLRGHPDAPFDMNSLEALGELFDEENETFLCSILADQGETAAGIIASLMQDLGVLLRFNSKTGLYEFFPIREPVQATVPHATDDMILPPEPEIATLIGDRPSDHLIFKFTDRKINYRDNAISRDDDGAAVFRGHVKTTTTTFTTLVDRDTAESVANRRAQEQLGNQGTVALKLNREGRALLPGGVLTVEASPSVLRVLEKEVSQDNLITTLSVTPDFYGLPKSTDVGDPSAGGKVGEEEEEVGGDIFTFTEIPAYVNREQEIEIAILRIRSNAQVVQATIHLSRDGITYRNSGVESQSAAGGQLAEDISADDPTLWLEGPLIQIIGPDINLVEDLSGDDLNWRLGRQLCVIDEEIFFLRRVTAINEDLWRLDGLIRARYDTKQTAHAAGTPVFIIPLDNMNIFSDIMFAAGKTLHLKSQPETSEAIDLADVAPVSKTLVGKGIGPVAPLNLRTQNFRNDFATGADIPLRWSYRSTLVPKTGAGQQGAGEPTAPSPIDGKFVIRIFDAAGTSLKREVPNLSTTVYTYTNANLVSDFGSEPTSFMVRVTNVKSGLESGIEEQIIVRV